MKKNIPKIREWEGNEKIYCQISETGKIHSHNLGMGIRGYHSQEFPGTGTGMKKHNMTIKEKYLANMWREKEFWPKHSQPHPPPFLIIPRLLVVVTATINEQKSKQNDLIHYN